MLKRLRTPGAIRLGLFLCACVGLLLTASLALAATSYGEIRGQVKDATGGVLPGVSVEARGPSLQGTKTATSAGDGTYRIALVPPGDYTVSFALAGFGKVEKKAAVQLDKTVVVEAAMSLATTAAVTVTGAAPVIDATSSGSGMNFTSDVLKGLPLGRGFTSVATKAPGVIQGYGVDSGNINVQGSTGAENNFIIDGVDVTEIQYGRQGKNAPSEFIQEIEVKAGGFQAEYGHSQGGVLNAITKSGGNAFHGDA
ncbi:MAG: carboxypeptidase regulatory-like domain-containing protein, partial [Burkholderiales bacterium]